MRDTKHPQSYTERLSAELDAIAASFADILTASDIKYVNPNRYDSEVVFVGASDWGWVDSDDQLESARMALLRRLRE